MKSEIIQIGTCNNYDGFQHPQLKIFTSLFLKDYLMMKLTLGLKKIKDPFVQQHNAVQMFHHCKYISSPCCVDDDDHNQKQKLFFKFYFPHLIDDA
jgi:hypothetical protein